MTDHGAGIRVTHNRDGTVTLSLESGPVTRPQHGLADMLRSALEDVTGFSERDAALDIIQRAVELGRRQGVHPLDVVHLLDD